MRYIFITSAGVVDSSTGETLELAQLERALLQAPGGVIAGNNLYPVLSRLIPMIKSDHGWSARLKLQKKKKYKTGVVGGAIYYTHLTYRHPKKRSSKGRYRPGSVKWLVLNLELFTETKDIAGAAEALVGLAQRRGIKTRDSPGAFGGALLRSSPQWEKGRNPAPWFISELARFRLPGNYYALRAGVSCTTVEHAYYIDQKSSHHTIASSVDLPHPAYLHARGYMRAIEKGKYPKWIEGDEIATLCDHIGVLCAVVECSFLPLKYEHLYPPWAKRRGKHVVWLWTPELRLLDSRVRLRWISGSLTSYKLDPALKEFALWSLDQLENYNHPAIKPALLAAYGLLGARTDREIERYSISGRPKSPRADLCNLPLIGECHRSTVNNVKVPVTQNVVARGVIEAETRTRSIEYARELEWEHHIPVTQIYADGVIVSTDQLPFVPVNWRVAGELSQVRSPSPNTIISPEMTRTPGIPSGRRTVIVEQTSTEVVPF
jgi:hypothetical protein